MDTRKCPECGIENEMSRVTCKVCRARMLRAKDEKKDSPTQEPEQLTTGEAIPPEQPAPKKRKPRTTPTKDTSPKSEPEPETPKKIVRRRRRKVQATQAEPLFFQLVDGKLTAVNVRLLVTKPIPTKELGDIEKGLVTLWNRNKDLVSG